MSKSKAHRFSTKLMLSPYSRSDGKQLLKLRVIINRNVKKYSTSQYISPNKWDAKKCCVINPGSRYADLQDNINALQSKADKILFDLSSQYSSVTFESFETAMFTKGGDFFLFCFEQLELMKLEFKPNYIRRVRSDLNKLKKFRSSIDLQDIDYNFIQKYDSYLRSYLANQHNTASKSLATLKMFFNRAEKLDMVKQNPFNAYKVTYKPVTRNFLTLDEVNKLREVFHEERTHPKLKHVLRYFLFACYTGLRFEDIRLLSWSAIVDNKYLNIVQQKTMDQTTIPLVSQALELIPTATGGPNASVFNAYSNQKTNDYLKASIILAGIAKDVSFHTARHTFATVSLNLGIPLVVVQKILGHRSIRTTEIYAKLMDQTKFEEMRKWEI